MTPQLEINSEIRNLESVPHNLFNRNLLLILVLGLTLRLLLLLFFWDKPLTIVDEQHYEAIAENILNHQEFALQTGKPTSIRPPLYPAFLSAIYFLTGGIHHNAVRVIQILLSLAIIYLIYRLGKRIFDERVGLIAALLFAVYPSFLFFTQFLLTEVLFTLLLLLFVWFFLSFLERRNGWHLFLAGIFMGLAALTRSVLYPFVGVVLLYIFVVCRGAAMEKLKWAGLLILGYALMIAPWSIRNTHLQGQFVIIGTMGGLNLYLGNYEHTPLNRAWAAIDLTGDKTWYYGHETTLSAMNEAQKQSWAVAMAKDFMLRHKLLTLKRSLIKAADLWGLERSVIGVFVDDHYPGLNKTATSLVWTPLIFGSFCVVMVGALFGLVYNLSSARSPAAITLVLVLFFTMAHAIVFGHPRYHLPLIPVLGIFSAWSLINFKLILAQKKTNRFKYSLLLSSFLLISWITQIIFFDGARFLTYLNI